MLSSPTFRATHMKDTAIMLRLLETWKREGSCRRSRAARAGQRVLAWVLMIWELLIVVTRSSVPSPDRFQRTDNGCETRRSQAAPSSWQSARRFSRAYTVPLWSLASKHAHSEPVGLARHHLASPEAPSRFRVRRATFRRSGVPDKQIKIANVIQADVRRCFPNFLPLIRIGELEKHNPLRSAGRARPSGPIGM
jgi:hypothetical protein